MKIMRAITFILFFLGTAALLSQRNLPCKLHNRDFLHYTRKSCTNIKHQMLSHSFYIGGDYFVRSKEIHGIRSLITTLFAQTAVADPSTKRSGPVTRLLKFILAAILYLPNVTLSGLNILFGGQKSRIKQVTSTNNSAMLQPKDKSNNQPYQWYYDAYMRATGYGPSGSSSKSIFDYRPWARQKKWSPHNVINKQGDLSPQSILEWRSKSNDTSLTSILYPSSFVGPTNEAQKLTLVQLNKLNNTRSLTLEIKEFVKPPSKMSAQDETSSTEMQKTAAVTKLPAVKNDLTAESSLPSTKPLYDDKIVFNSVTEIKSDIQKTNAKAVSSLIEKESIPMPKELIFPPRSTSILVQSLVLYPDNPFSAPTPQRVVQQQRKPPQAVTSEDQIFATINSTTTSTIVSKWTDDDASLLGSLMTGVIVSAAFGWEPGVIMTATSGYLIARNYNITGKIVHNVGELVLASIKVASVIDNSFNVSSIIKTQFVSALNLPKR